MGWLQQRFYKLILLDDAALDAIYRSVPGARIDHSGWILPTKSRPSDISFSVAGKFFAISGEDLKFADAGGGMSFGSIQSRGQNRQDILGDVRACLIPYVPSYYCFHLACGASFSILM